MVTTATIPEATSAKGWKAIADERQKKINELLGAIKAMADEARLGFSGDADEAETLSNINNYGRAILARHAQ